MSIVMLWFQNDWDLFGRRYEMIARAWVAAHPDDNMLVVEPPLNPWIWMKGIVGAVQSSDWLMVRYWLSWPKKIFQPLTQAEDRLWVLQPFFWWPFRVTGDSFLTRFSFGRALSLIHKFSRKRGWKNPLLWVYPPHPFIRYVVDRWPGDRICADLVDDNLAYVSQKSGLNNEYISTYEKVLDRASVAFSVSKPLAEKFSTLERQIVYIPNAVPLNGEVKINESLPKLPAGPKACYVGRLDERMDFKLLKSVMQMRPEVRFVFIGTMDPRSRAAWKREIFSLPNAHYLGTVPYRTAAQLLKQVDVCILPHLVNALTKSMDPIKLYVYLKAGKPVIATGVSVEAGLESSLISVKSAEEFSRALDNILGQPFHPALPDMSRHTWQGRVAEMSRRLAPMRA